MNELDQILAHTKYITNILRCNYTQVNQKKKKWRKHDDEEFMKLFAGYVIVYQRHLLIYLMK